MANADPNSYVNVSILMFMMRCPFGISCTILQAEMLSWRMAHADHEVTHITMDNGKVERPTSPLQSHQRGRHLSQQPRL